MTTRTSEAPPPLPTTRTTLTRVRSQAWHLTPEAYRKSWNRCPRHAASGERRQRTTKHRESTAPASRLASESLILRAFFEAYVARSVGTEGVAAAVGGASSAAGSGRGSDQTNVLLKDVFDTTW